MATYFRPFQYVKRIPIVYSVYTDLFFRQNSASVAKAVLGQSDRRSFWVGLRVREWIRMEHAS
jgi:hypothetical protein